MGPGVRRGDGSFSIGRSPNQRRHAMFIARSEISGFDGGPAIPGFHRCMRYLPLVLMLFAASSQANPATEPLPSVLAEVRTQLGKNDLDAAIDAAERSQEALPDDPRVWFWSGRAYGLQAMAANILTKPKWAGRSRDAYEKSVAMAPELIEARYELMQYYLFAPGFLGGGRDKAEAQVAVMSEQDLVWGKLGAAALASADKQPEVAERILREAVEAKPDSQLARRSLANLLQRQTRWGEVRALWQERLDVAADQPMARYQLGRAAALSGESLEDGLAMLDAYIAAGINAENVSMGAAHWRRGLVLEKLNRPQDALAALTLAMADDDISGEAKADHQRLSERK